jgi:DNA-binding Lrp family transcriptional regulator
MRMGTRLKSYESVWYATPFFDDYGFTPLREETYALLRERVWVKPSKKKLHPGEVILDTEEPEVRRYNKFTNMTDTEYKVLLELGRNGRSSFKEIAEKLDISPAAASYAYVNLKAKGFVKRITLTIERLPIRYNALLFADIIEGEKVEKTRKELLMEIIEGGNWLTNRYTLVGDVDSPHGIVFILPVFNENDIIMAEQRIKNKVKGVKIRTAIMSTILLGNFCYRRFDSTYTSQYDTLVNEYKAIEPRPKLDYEE